jgi:DNA-binding SARP family transcriptional activator
MFGSVAVSRGALTLGCRDFGGTKAKQLFQLLVLARGEAVPKDRLADIIWGESLPVHVNATLETYVSVLRRKLAGLTADGSHLITTEREAYALPTEGYVLDLFRFDELVLLADVAEPSARRRCLDDALALVTGEVLADEPYSDWAIDERWRYERRVIDAAVAASSAALDDRDARSALVHAERVMTLEPLDERGYHAALLALCALGRTRDALALYDRCCSTFAKAGCMEVSPELRDLRVAIERREVVAAGPRAGTTVPAEIAILPPAARLLGRTAELDRLSEALASTAEGGSAFALIEGEVGIGKTTLLQAASQGLTGVNVGWASCSELVSGIPYAALALALRKVLCTSEVDVRRYPALAAIFPEMSVRSSRAAPRTADALEALVALAEDLAPFVLVLDDLHWADADSLVALAYLCSRGPLPGVSVVAAVRPEEVDNGHPVGRLRPTLVIPLEALEEHDLAPLGIPDLYHRTGGHPLFVSFAVAPDEKGKRALSESVAARCRAEGDDAYQLLTTACLLEEPFSASRVAGVLGLSTTDVARALDRLCRRRLLCVEDGKLRFRARSMREALADSLSPPSRTILEQRISRDGPPGPRTEPPVQPRATDSQPRTRLRRPTSRPGLVT